MPKPPLLPGLGTGLIYPDLIGYTQAGFSTRLTYSLLLKVKYDKVYVYM